VVAIGLHKRTKIEITAIVLQIAASRNGLSKSGVMLRAYLTSTQANNYMRQLFEQRLLEYVGGKRTYRTTVKGLQYLETYKRLGAMLGMRIADIPRLRS
jgi:predicted transcriptional regulator